jgi:hypothetical protein
MTEAEELKEARETNRRLNREKQKLERLLRLKDDRYFIEYWFNKGYEAAKKEFENDQMGK